MKCSMTPGQGVFICEFCQMAWNPMALPRVDVSYIEKDCFSTGESHIHRASGTEER